MNLLTQYGINDRFYGEAGLYPNLYLARVVSQSKDLYRIVTEQAEGLAEVSGKFRYGAASLTDYPAVGDFVMADRLSMEDGNAIIHHVLTRKSVFLRTAVGHTDEAQVVAANIDLVFICMSLNQDYNLRRLERYLSIAWDSRATPVVVLTKSDLCEDLEAVRSELASVAIGVDVVMTSALVPSSFEEIGAYLQPGVTASFIGSSGVGKSTLINLLLGQAQLDTGAIRQDDKGRHTTTRRELLVLKDGGIVIDTPGMRELGVQSVNLSKSFVDIDELAAGCRFADCTHTSEPGCAILAALNAGTLDQARLQNYLKLEKEARYNGLSSRQIETEKLNRMFGGVGGMKKARDFIKDSDKRRR